MPTFELLDITKIDLQDRVRYPTDGLEDLIASIERFGGHPNGLLQPIIVDENNVLQDGWRRFTACQHLKWPTIPVYRRAKLNAAEYEEIEFETNFQRLNFTWQETIKQVCRIHRSRTNEAILQGKEWTQEHTGKLLGDYSRTYVSNCILLENLIDTETYKDCQSITDAVRLRLKIMEDMVIAEKAKRTKLCSPSIPVLFDLDVDDEPPPPPVEGAPQTVQLSRMLYNMDCRDFLTQLPPESIDHVLSDPPYAIEMDNLEQGSQQMISTVRVEAEHDVKENMTLLSDVIPLLHKVLKPTGFCVLWCDIMRWQYLFDLGEKAGFRVQKWPFVWVKMQAKNQMAHFNTTKTCEFAIVMSKKDARLPAPVPFGHVICNSNADKTTNVFAKPTEVWTSLVNAFTIAGQTILDPFAGGGSGPRTFLELNRPTIAVEKSTIHFPYLIENVKQFFVKTLGPKTIFT